MGGIYFIFCTANNKTYIGSAKNLCTRWHVHQKMLNNQMHYNKNLQRAWDKYGEDCFEYSVKEELGEYDKNYFFQRENFWIDMYHERNFPIFNIARAEGGWGPETFLRKNEIAAKISASLKAKMNLLSPDERKFVYGKGKKGISLSAEHKRKTSEGLKGKLKSDETRARMSASQKARAVDNPVVANNMAIIGKQNKGRTPINAIPLTIDGVEYQSCQHASTALGIPYRQITKMRKAQQNDYGKEKET